MGTISNSGLCASVQAGGGPHGGGAGGGDDERRCVGAWRVCGYWIFARVFCGCAAQVSSCCYTYYTISVPSVAFFSSSFECVAIPLEGCDSVPLISAVLCCCLPPAGPQQYASRPAAPTGRWVR